MSIRWSRFPPRPSGPSPVGAVDGALDSVTTTLTNAQVKALPTTAVELVPAAGANRIIAPLMAWLFLDWTADYSNLDPAGRIGIGFADTLSPVLAEFGDVELGNLLQDGASHVAFAGLRSSIIEGLNATQGVGQFRDEPGVVGEALVIYGFNGAAGNFTGGNAANTLTVSVFFTIIELAA